MTASIRLGTGTAVLQVGKRVSLKWFFETPKSGPMGTHTPSGKATPLKPPPNGQQLGAKYSNAWSMKSAPPDRHTRLTQAVLCHWLASAILVRDLSPSCSSPSNFAAMALHCSEQTFVGPLPTDLGKSLVLGRCV